MSAREPPLSDEECAALHEAVCAGRMPLLVWTNFIAKHPELAAFVRAVETREGRDDDSVSAVLKRCGYRVH